MKTQAYVEWFASCPDGEESLIDYVRGSLGLLDFLEELHLLPDQLRKGSLDWYRMLAIARHHRAEAGGMT